MNVSMRILAVSEWNRFLNSQLFAVTKSVRIEKFLGFFR